MKLKFVFSLGMALFASALPLASADETISGAELVESGLSEGYLPPFHVTKVAGATQDGVDEGEKLCYRCRNGSKPQVVVFTRSKDEQVTELLKRLDAAMETHEEDQLRVFVNVLAQDRTAAVNTAKQLVSDSAIQNIPVVVPADVSNGPQAYQLNPEAEVTVTFSVDGNVTASQGFGSGGDIRLDMVMGHVAKIIQ